MTLEPRSVAPGFVRRWPRQALELLMRGFHWSFGLAFGACLLYSLLLLTPLSLVLVVPGGLFMYCVQCELAAAADRQVLTLAAGTGVLREAARAALGEVWRRRGMVGAQVVWLLVMGLVLAQLDPGAPEAATRAPEPDLGSVWTWLASPASPLMPAAVALVCGSLFQGRRLLASLSYCLQRLLGVPAAQGDVLREKAASKNLLAAAFVDAVHLVGGLVALVALPGLTPLLMGFLPALSYVAFREMFVDGEGNRVPQRQAQSVSHLAGATGTAT